MLLGPTSPFFIISTLILDPLQDIRSYTIELIYTSLYSASWSVPNLPQFDLELYQ